MEKAKVYFSDFRTRIGVSQGAKLQKLIRTAGIGSIDFDGKFVAIKMHFGELGNFAYLRPNYVKAKALNENMEEFIIEGEELLARAICHELDHLDGHIYTELVQGPLQDVEYDDDEE